MTTPHGLMRPLKLSVAELPDDPRALRPEIDD